MTSTEKRISVADVLTSLNIQLQNMEGQKRERIRKGAAEILLQMIRVKNHDQAATAAQRDRLICHRKWGFCSNIAA